MLVSKDNVIPVNNMPFEIGAIAGCAISTPYRAIKNAGDIMEKDIAIIGLGGVGIHALCFKPRDNCLQNFMEAVFVSKLLQSLG